MNRVIRHALLLAMLTLLGASLLPVPVEAQGARPRSYYPTLTPTDIRVCRAEFAALKSDVAQYFRGIDRRNPNSGWREVLTRVESTDPVALYAEGFSSDGQGFGGLATLNEFEGETSREIHQRNLTQELPSEGPNVLEWSLYRAQTRAAADRCVARIWMARLNAMHPTDGNGPGPLGLRNMPVASVPDAGAPDTSPVPTPVSAATGDVFDDCIDLEGPDQRGIQMMWQLRNKCQTRISLSYCLRADFEAAGDYNLCTRREYKTHSVAPGATVHFEFGLMPPGTNLSDGRQVTHNTLRVRGYACANDSSPRVHFDDGQLVFRGC